MAKGDNNNSNNSNEGTSNPEPQQSVKESARSKALKALETPEEICKDVATMYTKSKKLVANSKNTTDEYILKSLLQSMKKAYDETGANSHAITYTQACKWWNDAFTHLQAITSLA